MCSTPLNLCLHGLREFRSQKEWQGLPNEVAGVHVCQNNIIFTDDQEGVICL